MDFDANLTNLIYPVHPHQKGIIPLQAKNFTDL